jgi:hypothetical protein
MGQQTRGQVSTKGGRRGCDVRPVDPPLPPATNVQAPRVWQEGHRANLRPGQALRREPSPVPELCESLSRQQVKNFSIRSV